MAERGARGRGRVRALGVVCVAALAVAACGSSDTPSSPKQPAAGKRVKGGTLRVLYQGDVDSIDPGRTYYVAGYIVTNATQRTVTSYRPNAPQRPAPDLAASPPTVSRDARTVTVRLRSGVRFSPPVNREVTSRDVKYAIERGFFRTVANPYVGTYFGALVGAKQGAAPGTRIAGIRTPDDRTVVFRLTRPTGSALAGALVLPLSAPVPQEYAARFDTHNPSDYGTHQVATGPYMIANDARGRTVGYRPSRGIRLVRNPNWRAATDYRPAYLDGVDIVEGNDDTGLAADKVLAGHRMASGEFPVPAEVIARALKGARGQIAMVRTGGLDYVPLNTAIAPFDDLNVRRAVLAGIDREAVRKVQGGAIRGPLATHLIPPGVPGWAQAGGAGGDGLDFMSHPRGDMDLAARYFRAAGYASGRYEGGTTVLLVGINDPTTKLMTQIVQRDLGRMGFDVRTRYVTTETFFTKFCGSPAMKVNACVGWTWFRDFPDGQTILDPTFNGAAIQPADNANAAQLDVPAINAAMSRAEALTDPAARAGAWAAVDRQVTAQAPAILGTWNNAPIVHSKDVAAVPNAGISGWDLGFTSLR
jgi:peptide/nickel transport system substrate-binding protein